MSLVEQISLEDNQRNQKSEQAHRQSYHHRSIVEESAEEHETTTTSSNITATSTSSSKSIPKSSGLDFLSISSSPSPLGPTTAHPPLTSTPRLTLVLSSREGEISEESVKSNQIAVSESHTITSSNYSENSSSSVTNTKVAVTSESEDPTPIVPRDQEESEPQSSLVSDNSSRSTVNVQEQVVTSSTENHSTTESAITIIQVQSNPQPEDMSTPKATTKTSLQETDLDTDVNTDVDGLAITRIQITGDKSQTQRQPSPSPHPAVKITVLNGSGQEVEDRSGSVTPTNATRDDLEESSNSRGPVRFDEGLPGLSRSGVGSQPSDLNDTVSEISSVVNNPSVISALPDR